MFWRHPEGKADSGNWPKCSAKLKGLVVDQGKIVGEAKTNMWLHVLEIQQPGENSFTKVGKQLLLCLFTIVTVVSSLTC